MSLQIRRGTEAQRSAITFDLGEIVYTTDSKKLYVGDGGTPGGNNILSTAAGTGLTWNSTTNTLNFSGDLSGYTTDNISEGTVNQYFTRSRAQDAAASMFTAVGSPVVTGTVTSTTAPHTVTVSSNSGLVALEPFVVTGTGGNLLVPGTYYIVNPAAGTNQITVASSLADAQAGTTFTVTTGGLSTTNFSAGGGGDSNITFTYNSTAKTMTATVSSLAAGIHSVNEDTSPLLGGNLGLNNHNITGTGNINITGNISASGTISATTGLGANLPLNSYNITGTGNIGITGTLSATGGLGSDLSLNSHTLGGSGNITLSGNLTVSQPNNGFPLVDYYSTVSPGNSYITINASRGTIQSPSTVSAGDELSGMQVLTYDGTSFGASVVVSSFVDTNGTISTGVVPGKFVVGVQSGAVGATSKQFQILSFNSLGVLNAPVLQTGLYATGSYPTNPAKGMIIFDSTSNHFYGYNGTAWVAFTGP
jgi:Major tropism determinant N-terminal domain